MIRFAIKFAIDQLEAAIEARQQAGQPGRKLATDQLRRLEEEVSIQSRALFSRYLDVAHWEEDLDPEETETVRQALRKALACLKTDQPCIASVRNRCQDFERFCNGDELIFETWEVAQPARAVG
jgi:hypothetical protein